MENTEQRQPFQELPTRERFMDYCGNPWAGVKMWIELMTSDNYKNKGTIPEKIKKPWNDFFSRIKIFLENGFEANGNITPENLKRLLLYKDKNPFEPGVFEEINNLYKFTIKNEK